MYGETFLTYFPSFGHGSGNTAIATTYRGCLDVLLSEDACVSAADAFLEYMQRLYAASCVLLVDGVSHTSRRQEMERALNAGAIKGYLPVVDRLVEKHVSRLQDGVILDPYPFCKLLFDELTYATILGDAMLGDGDGDGNLQEQVRRWRSDHFSAIVALPVSVNFGSIGVKSSFARGDEARLAIEKLVSARVRAARTSPQKRLRPRQEASVLAQLSEDTSLTSEVIATHIGVLLNSATSKACAATLTFLILELSCDATGTLVRRCRDSDSFLESCVMETLRLHPPLLGSIRRIGKKSSGVIVNGTDVPGNHRLWTSTRHANCDEQVYPSPEKFDPDRWALLREADFNSRSACPFRFPTDADRNRKASAAPHLSFGAGSRRCPGRDLAWTMIISSARRLLQRFSLRADGWERVSVIDTRHFPVLRPSGPVRVRLTPTKLEGE